MNKTSSPLTSDSPAYYEREYALHLDQYDPHGHLKNEFHIPTLGGDDPIHYLCGNSLGLQPKKAELYVQEELEKWKKFAVEGHFHPRNPWFSYHEILTPLMAPLVGALQEEVVIANTLTVNLHLAMVSFYRPTRQRYKIVIEQGAFPSDIYAVKSQLEYHGHSAKDGLIELIPRHEEETLRNEDIYHTLERYKDEIALVLLGGVNYRTGQLMPLQELAKKCQQWNICLGLDLAHAVGNVPLELHNWGVDFAVWCTYKYLNSGPGGAGGLFIHERHLKKAQLPRFAGWWGQNKETRFRMDDQFDPIPTAEGWQLSNPPILPLASLRASLEVFASVPFSSLVNKSHKLTNYMIELLGHFLGDKFALMTPKNTAARGCQLSIKLVGDIEDIHQTKKGTAILTQLKAKRIICDYRSPNIIRVTPVPLYNTYEDVYLFSKEFAQCLLALEER